MVLGVLKNLKMYYFKNTFVVQLHARSLSNFLGNGEPYGQGFNENYVTCLWEYRGKY